MFSQSRKKALRETAAIWFYRLQYMEADHPERSRFESWLMESAEHQAAYSEVEEISQKLNSTQEINQLNAVLKNQHAAKRNSPLKSSVAILSAFLFIWMGVVGYQDWQAQPVLQMATIANVGEVKSQQMEDGSKLVVNSKSSLEITYYRNKRLVKLNSGEVIFEVARDESRPFIVDLGTTRVTVLGTRFAVNRLKNLIRVSVDHGSVSVQLHDSMGNALAQPIILTNNQVAEVHKNSMPRKINRSAEDAFSFEHGIVVLENANIEEIAETIGRYRVKPIILSSLENDQHRISARVSVKNIEGFLNRLPRLLPVVLEDESGLIVIKGQKEN